MSRLKKQTKYTTYNTDYFRELIISKFSDQLKIGCVIKIKYKYRRGSSPPFYFRLKGVIIFLIELQRKAGENDEQYLWRIGNLIEAGQAPHWREIINTINEEFGLDEDDYRDESAYRKKYQAAKKFYDNVFADMVSGDFSDDYEKQRQEIFKAKQQLSDERTALNRKLRDNARNIENINIIITIKIDNKPIINKVILFLLLIFIT